MVQLCLKHKLPLHRKNGEHVLALWRRTKNHTWRYHMPDVDKPALTRYSLYFMPRSHGFSTFFVRNITRKGTCSLCVWEFFFSDILGGKSPTLFKAVQKQDKHYHKKEQYLCKVMPRRFPTDIILVIMSYLYMSELRRDIVDDGYQRWYKYGLIR